MAKKEVALEFSNEFLGTLKAPRGTAAIGVEEGTLEPYDLLFGALGSCLYATFLEIARKKRIGFEKAEMQVSGTKREEIPTTLKEVHVSMTVHGAEKEKGLVQAMQLATEYCSIYTTISKVAEMTYTLNFIGTRE